MSKLTLEELKEHCLKTLSTMHKFGEIHRQNFSDISNDKSYQEHKIVLDLIEEHEKLSEIKDIISECENCETCQGFREYPTSRAYEHIKEIIYSNK